MEPRNDFMIFLSESLESDTDNYRYNSILEAADEYADAEVNRVKREMQRKIKKVCKEYRVSYGKKYGGFAKEIATILEEEGVSNE